MANALASCVVFVIGIRMRMTWPRSLARRRHRLMAARPAQNLRVADEHEHGYYDGEEFGAEEVQSRCDG